MTTSQDTNHETLRPLDSTNGAEAFVAMDYELKFIYVNKLAENFYKKTKAELIGKSLRDVFPAEMEFGPFKSAVRNLLERKGFELSYQSPFLKDWVTLTGRPFENYFTFTYRAIDYREVLKDELRSQLGRSK